MKMPYGPAKALHEITLEEMRAHPIWLWSIHIPLPVEEDAPSASPTGLRAWLGTNEVTPGMDLPQILLQVKGTDLWAAGIFDQKKRKVDSIRIFGSAGATDPAGSLTRPGPIVYVAVPRIAGQEQLEFHARSRIRDEAWTVDALPSTEDEDARDASASGLIRKDPKARDLTISLIQQVGQETLAGGVSVLVIEVGGGLADEHPALFQELLEKAAVRGLQLCGVAEALPGHGIIRHAATRRPAFALGISAIEQESPFIYRVKSCLAKDDEDFHVSDRRFVLAGGQWLLDEET